MGWVAPVASLVGTGVSAYGQYKAGKGASDVYDYNKQMARYEAKYIQDRAAIEEARLNKDVSRHISRQRAIAGASGTSTNTGSNLDVLTETVNEAELDAAIIRYNADVQSSAALSQSNLYSTQADQAYSSGILNAGTTLLGGASKYDWKKKPLPTPFYPGRPATSTRFGVGPGV